MVKNDDTESKLLRVYDYYDARVSELEKRVTRLENILRKHGYNLGSIE